MLKEPTRKLLNRAAAKFKRRFFALVVFEPPPSAADAPHDYGLVWFETGPCSRRAAAAACSSPPPLCAREPPIVERAPR